MKLSAKDLTPYQLDAMHGKICPYCKCDTKVVSQEEVYGQVYSDRKIVACKNFPHCDSYVGCDDEGKPLGRLSNKQLRYLKTMAHNAFDPIWKQHYLKRKKAYRRLGVFLGLERELTHIGMFNADTCRKVIIWSNKTLNDLKKSK